MSSPSAEPDNAAQIAYWNDKAADTWTGFQERLDALFQPLTVLALDAAAPAPGERVVDIGCGCGATVLALADRVGPAGSVLALDVSAPMSARARQRIAAAGLNNAEVLVSDAAVHGFAGADADLMFSRFGIMFFADPVAAFVNLRRAMRPGGRLLCAVWRPLTDNPWFRVPLEAVRPLLPPQPPVDSEAPGPFALANRERTVGILEAAGWREVELTRHDVPMKLGQMGEAVDFATRMGAVARLLADVSSEVQAAAKAEVAKALATYANPDGVSLIGSIWLVSARA